MPSLIHGTPDVMTSSNFPLRGILQWLSRKLRFPLTLFWGRFFLPVPRRTPMVYVLGRPLRPIPNKNPSRLELDAQHAEFEEELTSLFDTFRPFCAAEDSQLIVK